MKHCSKPIAALFVIAMFVFSPVQAQDEEKMVIKIETENFSLGAIDVSSLEVGEAKTIETDSGQVVDILRTLDEFEIYIDGELIDLGFDHDPGIMPHMVHNLVKITCDEEDDACVKHVFVNTKGDEEITALIAEDGANLLLHKNIEVSCSEEGDQVSCDSYTVWSSGDEEINLEVLHEEHVDAEGQRVIVITSEIDSDD